jgi:hypothetical protein
LAIQLQYQKLDTMESYRTFISFIRKLNTWNANGLIFVNGAVLSQKHVWHRKMAR